MKNIRTGTLFASLGVILGSTFSGGASAHEVGLRSLNVCSSQPSNSSVSVNHKVYTSSNKLTTVNSNVKWVDPKYCSNNKNKAGTQYTNNWSGYVARDARYPVANFVDSTYIEPAVKTSLTTDSAEWVGIGGAVGSKMPLIQSGTHISTINGKATHRLFFEVYPNENIEEITNISVKPGDKIYSSAAWNSGKAIFNLCDLTQNICTNITESNISAPGNSAEWISEKTTPNNGLNGTLANYSKLTFTNNHWLHDSKGAPIHSNLSAYAQKTVMSNSTNNHILSTPGAINKNQNFTNYWVAAK